MTKWDFLVDLGGDKLQILHFDKKEKIIHDKMGFFIRFGEGYGQYPSVDLPLWIAGHLVQITGGAYCLFEAR